MGVECSSSLPLQQLVQRQPRGSNAVRLRLIALVRGCTQAVAREEGKNMEFTVASTSFPLLFDLNNNSKRKKCKSS
jgi:hypothetical protein